MAIYSLHHSSIGKSTQAAPGTASAHINYITRESALSATESSRMPGEKRNAMGYLLDLEGRMRANARIADKLLLALPRELTSDQRRELVRTFAAEVSQGKTPWFAAFHEKGKDEHNPHCHMVLVDRDPATGRRVFKTSDAGSTERLRTLWEQHANAALLKAGRSERIDRRTLKAQGVERRPTIHVGVRARQLIGKNIAPRSRNRIQRNHCQAKTSRRKVDYPAIDGGKLRLLHNVEIRRSNMFASRAAKRAEEYWSAIDEDAFMRDIHELRRLNAVLQYGDDGSTFRARDERPRGPELTR
ncbi:MobA/MobL family protein [Agrobacterium pusense]|uniref:MobA/MobL family protein n=1 Tax=Agrobacterium pusense TaxID=648995 RepID=UPI00068F7A85|nr:MobA/MobL family protein [Agrobacterium pusense]ANV25621.1 hypothetical protein BA939_16490 [Rhizobium sp. S41]QWW77769.1 MobA/MobL family protein [Agrobacterium pusense]